MAEEKVETIYEGKFLRMLKSGRWEYVSRTNASGVVVILPITAERKIILIEQFRTAVGRKVIGLPAGLAGDEEGTRTEDLIEAAKRELLEETGYAASRWRWLAEGPSSPGMTDELITFFVAEGAMVKGKIGTSTDEEITVWEVPLDELAGWLEEKTGRGSLIDYKIFAALYLWTRLEKLHPG